MKDYVIRVTAANGFIRGFAARTTDLVQEAQRLHGLSPVASAALGRTMTAAVMLGADMKGKKDTLSLIIKGDGPLGSVVVVATSGGYVKGYVANPKLDLPLNVHNKLDVAAAVGKNGRITVIKDLGLKEPYIGQANLISGEIAEDVAYYLTVSEQQPSAVALGVLVNPDCTVKAAGGFIIQALPGAPEDVIAAIEKKVSSSPSISRQFDEGRTPEEVLEGILGEHGMKVNAIVDVQFKCDCNRQRLKYILMGMDEKELIDIIENDKRAEVVCHYCNKKYIFEQEELKELLEQRRKNEENPY
ncbi:Hsp33 family molecular chaperone HslO [Caldicoprobacter algeriensis]|uniref:Hsp33 family molecular chaperone HslO n=1 Tax=Caldicoprobacter algeriensis TaxID=699281 RepID=UPI002079BA6D|nr:Hsp33 family molecular chaperone HslO [Caldicoprobacter algeriensis]MCM8899974.1 Hsp33 family molecular chaperone HslO [Caldicoprobacter algeriensis]